MLKITLHDSPHELRFRLEGRLSGAWVAELRQSWVTAVSTTQGRTTVLDLRDVDFIDAEGQALIANMRGQGVQLKAETPLIRSLVEEIERGAPYGTVEGTPSERSDVLVCSDQPARDPRAV